ILKREMFYGQEHKYKDLNELEQAIHKYIDYYNNVRIKTGRKNGSIIFLTDGCQVIHPSVRFFV
ncbi:IS3 family transposase, partial [Lactobacillus delbrueckii]|uniref:IS3 family transposase n=1 Tax=Lactobacillus delbrueckii TaxID=1584 RepID=UPI001E438920